MQSVIDKLHNRSCGIQIRGVIINNAKAGARERAKKCGIPVQVLSPSSFRNAEAYEESLLQTLQNWQPDLIVLAGYLLKIPVSVIQTYSKKIINIHPSLLPKFGGQGFYGIKVHEAVLGAREIKTGCSVHIVTEEYDQGRVLAQRTVPVRESDTPETLAERVLKQEHELLPEVILDYFSSQDK